MRSLSRILALSPSLLLWTLTLLSYPTDASSLNPLHPPAQLPFQIPPQASRSVNGRSWFSRARNSLIHNIWRIPSDDPLNKARGGDSTANGPPPTLLARYGGDLVLRFEIKSIEEAEALTEAVNVLFLDVWEFTAEWVDIRLSKDVVSLQCSTPAEFTIDVPRPLGSLAARSFAILPATCSYSSDA